MRLSIALLALFVPTVAHAQPTPEPVDGVVNFKLTLAAALPRQPITNDFFIPEYKDELPGEKLSGFMKCFMEQQVFFNAENSKKRYDFNQMPLDKLPKDVREQCGVLGGMGYSPKYANNQVMLDQAARFNRIEWNDYTNFRNDGAYALLPEIQKLRELVNVLAVRMRGEIINGEFDRALVTTKSIFGLGKMLEQHPCLIGNLVGIAVLQIGLNCLQEMIEQPGCPNLYWAFADLPKPLLSIRRGIEGERLFLTAQLDSLLNKERPLTQPELEKQLKYIEELVQIEQPGNPKPEFLAALGKPRIRYGMQTAEDARMKAARTRLTTVGKIPANVVEQYSPLQVVMADDLLQYQIYRDELMKWANMPFVLGKDGMLAAEKNLADKKTPLVLAPTLIATVLKVKIAETRITQKVALLQTIEALRLYAATHDGKLPPTLAEAGVPIPDDPFTGKPFSYEVKEGVAILLGSDTLATTLATGSKGYQFRYEISIKK